MKQYNQKHQSHHDNQKQTPISEIQNGKENHEPETKRRRQETKGKITNLKQTPISEIQNGNEIQT
jgi:hypothetical protein